MKENDQDNSEKPHVNEPPQVYNIPVVKKITVGSTQGQEEDMYTYWISLTPLQRLSHVYNLHANIYGNEMVNSDKKIGTRIIFDNP